MDRLAVCLRYYIADRLATDPGWKNIKVIFILRNGKETLNAEALKQERFHDIFRLKSQRSESFF